MWEVNVITNCRYGTALNNLYIQQDVTMIVIVFICMHDHLNSFDYDKIIK